MKSFVLSNYFYGSYFLIFRDSSVTLAAHFKSITCWYVPGGWWINTQTGVKKGGMWGYSRTGLFRFNSSGLIPLIQSFAAGLQSSAAALMWNRIFFCFTLNLRSWLLLIFDKNSVFVHDTRTETLFSALLVIINCKIVLSRALNGSFLGKKWKLGFIMIKLADAPGINFSDSILVYLQVPSENGTSPTALCFSVRASVVVPTRFCPNTPHLNQMNLLFHFSFQQLK